MRNPSRAEGFVERRIADEPDVDVPTLMRELDSRGIGRDRSTVYRWWNKYKAAHDEKPWTLAGDKTGRPDIVMRVHGARHLRYATTTGRQPVGPLPLSNREASWCVRLATALPRILTGLPGQPEAPTGLYEMWLWVWVRRYVRAEEAKDEGTMRNLDAYLARMRGDGGPFLRDEEPEPADPARFPKMAARGVRMFGPDTDNAWLARMEMQFPFDWDWLEEGS